MFLKIFCKSLRGALIAVAPLFLSLGCIFASAGAQAPASASGAGKDRARIEQLLNGLNLGRQIGQVAIAPDGKRLAWVELDSGGVEIRVAPLDDLKKSRRVTAAAKPEQHCREGEMAWSPDAQTLIFFSDCAQPGVQANLYLSRMDGQPAQRLTELQGDVNAPAFSPDGSRVAFLYVPNATRPAGALAAMKPPSGVIGEEGVEVQRVAVVRAESGGIQQKPEPVKLATPANLHVYEFNWSPDSKALAYVAADPPGEDNWWVAKLYTQTLDGEPKAILAPATVAGPLHGLQIAVPRWSPDGQAIAFIGGLMSDLGSTGGDVWMISSSGGRPRDLTPQRPTSPAWIEWDGDSHLFISELAGGNCRLVRIKLPADRTGESAAISFGRPVFSIPGTVGDGRMDLSLSSTADHSLFVFRASGFDQAPEIFLARTAAPANSDSAGWSAIRQLTKFNDGAERTWGKSVSLEWKSDQFHVQGWLMMPKDYDPQKKYPLIVKPHGGPAAADLSHWGGSWMLSAETFSALGYFVLLPNPRGSFGQGEAFAQANRKDFGYGDLRDILAGVDTVEAQYPVNPNRVGLIGWSYGGFMTMFAVTQTGRFKAAVAGAGISDWQSYYGENSIDQWMTPYFGASVYDAPAVYAKSSAINFIKQVRTPTLVLVGDRDGECPAPQSYEFWHALKDLHVPTELVVYPNEGHGFTNPAHRRDVMERAAEWFQKYMPAEE